MRMKMVDNNNNNSNTASSSTTTSKTTKTVMVTGANGYLASYIVKDLLASGHTVHACVRDASRTNSVQHLQSLPGASERLQLFSTGDLADATADTTPFDRPMKNCDAVLHLATPLAAKFMSGDNIGETAIYQPAMTSTQELLDCLERHASTVQCLVLTSSMAAVAPRPEPPLKDESHWSDPQGQKDRNNWYGCAKTSQELLVRDWVRKAKRSGTISPDFCYAAICPTMVIGPPLRRPEDDEKNPGGGGGGGGAVVVGGTMGSLQKWLQNGRSPPPAPPINDSMSFIHVQDCAKMHTKILELTASDINEHQRYMSLIESLHWNDILKLVKELHPGLPDYTPYVGDDTVRPTQVNLENMKSLQVAVKTTREAMQDSINYLKQIGALD